MMWLIIYIATIVVLLILTGVLNSYSPTYDEFEMSMRVFIVMIWPISLPILLAIGLGYCLIKLGKVIGKKIQEVVYDE